jgi:hypothetical protein
MSIVSTMHDVIEYTSKSKALAGQELLSYTFKVIKPNADGTPSPLMLAGWKAGDKPQNSCASVPAITDEEIAESIEKLLPVLKSAIYEERRLVLRDTVLAKKSTISTEEVSLSAIIARFEADSIGSNGRFSKASLKYWFDSFASPLLVAGMLAKQGLALDTPDDSPAMVKILNVLASVHSTLESLVFTKKAPSKEIVLSAELICSKLVTAGLDATDETLLVVRGAIDKWSGKAVDAENLADLL